MNKKTKIINIQTRIRTTHRTWRAETLAFYPRGRGRAANQHAVQIAGQRGCLSESGLVRVGVALWWLW